VVTRVYHHQTRLARPLGGREFAKSMELVPYLRHFLDGAGGRLLSMAVVLLVEDEEQVRVLAESYLEQQGHTVLSAGSPQGAIALLEKTSQIDVLFTDLDLKGDIRAGIKLAQEAIKRWPNLKVLYTTGRDLTDGMQAQFVSKSAFLAKPYTVEELSTALSVHFKINPQE
jgi:two-component system, response regulator PdtaR